MRDDDTAKTADDDRAEPPKDKPVNTAPDAVKDPNEKTGGKPGEGGDGSGQGGNDADPGGG